MGAAILAISAAPGSSVLAQGVDVSVCGIVEEYTPPTTRAVGSVTLDGDSFALAPGAHLPGAIRAGSDRCLVFTFDDTGRIASVANASGADEPDREALPAMPGVGADEDGDRSADAPETGEESAAREERAGGDGSAVIADAGSGEPEPVDTIAAPGADLPRTGGSAPTGGLFSLVSLAAAMLAGLGTFVLRRDA
jgi:hypothetical protein